MQILEFRTQIRFGGLTDSLLDSWLNHSHSSTDRNFFYAFYIVQTAVDDLLDPLHGSVMQRVDMFRHAASPRSRSKYDSSVPQDPNEDTIVHTDVPQSHTLESCARHRSTRLWIVSWPSQLGARAGKGSSRMKIWIIVFLIIFVLLSLLIPVFRRVFTKQT